jgi:hypothetical protein
LLSHNTLANYYQTVFALVQHHKYSITELENLIPYERDIYVAMLQEHLQKEKERHEAQQQKMKRR